MRDDATTPTGYTNPLIRMQPATGLPLFFFDRAPTQWGGPAIRYGYPRSQSNRAPWGTWWSEPTARAFFTHLQSEPPGHTLNISDGSLHPFTHDAAHLRCCSPPLLPPSRPSLLHATPPQSPAPPSDHLLLVAGEARARFIRRGSRSWRGGAVQAHQPTVMGCSSVRPSPAIGLILLGLGLLDRWPSLPLWLWALLGRCVCCPTAAPPKAPNHN
jgi:hypothetical protein